ncbi:MAG: hypothetical protein DDT29_02547 [Dehalococcoidia bacterium]|nr:hypothetical protein [Bacillota bacterium]
MATYIRCGQCLIGLGWDDDGSLGMGHICSPGNAHIVKAARESGVNPIDYVAMWCDVPKEKVKEFWRQEHLDGIEFWRQRGQEDWVKYLEQCLEALEETE